MKIGPPLIYLWLSELDTNIILFKSITMFYGADNTPCNIPTFGMNVGILCGILSVPHNTIMDMNNVTKALPIVFIVECRVVINI